MKISIYILVLIVLAQAASGYAQKSTDTTTYDAELAKRLGADEYGMKNYVLCILKTGPNDASVKGKQREEIFKGHMSNIGRMAAAGSLALAGPFGDNNENFRGIFIFDVKTVEEALKLTETDPAVKAGVFIADLLPWYGSASLMAAGEIHKRIAKQQP